MTDQDDAIRNLQLAHNHLSDIEAHYQATIRGRREAAAACKEVGIKYTQAAATSGSSRPA